MNLFQDYSAGRFYGCRSTKLVFHKFFNVLTAWWALYDAEPFKNQYVSEAKSRSRKAFFSILHQNCSLLC